MVLKTSIVTHILRGSERVLAESDRKRGLGARGMAQYPAPTGWHIPPVSSVPGASIGTACTWCTYIHEGKNIHTHKNK